MWTVPAALVVVTILLLWLHFVLALQIASTGRQIQIATEDLNEMKRQNAAIEREIAEAESPYRLAERAYDLGYRPRTPIYLPLAQPSSQTVTPVEQAGEAPLPETAGNSIWEALARSLDTWAKAQNTP